MDATSGCGLHRGGAAAPPYRIWAGLRCRAAQTLLRRLNLDLPQQLESVIRAKKLFRDGQKILVAVSGGLDSMALLALLDRLAAAHRWQLTAAHFNHQLRGKSSDADELLVRQQARVLGWPVAVGRGKVKEIARRRGWSVEMAARELRHAFLARAARQRGISAVATAHHADDQVELFFLRVLRGAGSAGLAGMKWAPPGGGTGHCAGPAVARPLEIGPGGICARARGAVFRRRQQRQAGHFAQSRAA